jgi:hypothetical protein
MLKTLTTLAAVAVAFAGATSASADVLISTSHLSGRCIQLEIWNKPYDGGNHPEVETSVYRGVYEPRSKHPAKLIAKRTLTATGTWRTYTLTCPTPGRYTVLLTGWGWQVRDAAYVPVPARPAHTTTVLPASASAYSLPRLPTELVGAAGLQVRPAVVGFTGDGTGFLGGFTGASSVGRPSREVLEWAGRMRWSTWTSTEASGTGAVWSNNGEPDDARGTFYPRAATVRAYDPVNGVFRRLTYVSGGQAATRRAVRYGGYWEWS